LISACRLEGRQDLALGKAGQPSLGSAALIPPAARDLAALAATLPMLAGQTVEQ